MRFALLGADAESCLLAEAAINQGHEIVWCGDISHVPRAAHDWLNFTDRADDWEALYDRELCDFVVIGRGEASPHLRATQAIELVKLGVAAVTSFPLSDSVLSYYEIDMARSESGAVLHHFNPLVMQDECLGDFARWIASGHPDLGRIEQLLCERPLEQRTQENIVWHFARDVQLLDRIAGPIDRLSALGSPDEEATYAGLNVQLLGKTQVPVRWTVGPIDQSFRPSLTFVAERGRLKFEFDDAGRFFAPGDGKPLEPLLAATKCIHQFVAAVDGAESNRSTTWPAALRAMELTDTIEISLRRGRTIDVPHQHLTEELSFRGTMSAVGCGVLLLLPPLLLLAGWLGELLGLPVGKNWWAYGLLALLAAFLLVQLAPKLLIKKTDASDPQ